jgi:hypothetical protein
MLAFLTADRTLRTLFSLVAVFALVLGLCPLAFAGEETEEEQAETLGDALKKGTFSLNLRYRYEMVDQDGFDDDAAASTVRTALGYRTLPWANMSAFIEVENITLLGDDDYNNKGAGHLANGMTNYPVVADPKLTEVNQAYLDFTFLPKTKITVGREEILLGNVRFVGNVGWRQNHQSFDALSLVNTSLPRTTIFYGYIDRVNRIFGDNKDMGSHLLNARIKLSDTNSLTLYTYLLDYCDEADWGGSTSTYGLNYTGSFKVNDDWKIGYDLEWATQGDFADNPNDVSADYYRVEAGTAKGKAFTFKIGHEVLGGSEEDGAFATPLATLHKWNGWADKFLGTPANGLADTYVILGGTWGAWGLKGIYHDFKADSGSMDYGTELDALLTWKAPWKQLFALKYADYSADEWSVDTRKIMFFTVWGF